VEEEDKDSMNPGVFGFYFAALVEHRIVFALPVTVFLFLWEIVLLQEMLLFVLCVETDVSDCHWKGSSSEPVQNWTFVPGSLVVEVRARSSPPVAPLFFVSGDQRV